jgi:hypothetical protein
MSAVLKTPDGIEAAMDHPPQLPAVYYLDDFMTVIEGVRSRYADHFGDPEYAYLERLRALSRAARMLYARLVNRRGPFFRVARLDYPEIGDVAAAARELVGAGFLAWQVGADAPAAVLGCFTCPELQAELHAHTQVRTARRAELVAWLGQWTGYGVWISGLLSCQPVVALPAADPFPFWRFLFFGELRPNLSDFVTRALCHIVTETVETTALRPLFGNRQQMEDAYRMAVLYQQFKTASEHQTSVEMLGWWQQHAINREDLAAGHAWFDRLVDRLGRALERAGETRSAAALYASSPVAPARERLARILIKSGDAETAVILLREMLAVPNDAQEQYAARQLLARLEQRSGRTQARDFERMATTLVLDYPPGGVEAAALAHYRHQGWNGVHSENWLWKASFGLLLWDIIYDAELGVFHSPFQFAPSDLHQPGFYQRRRQRIEARLAILAEPACAIAVMVKHFQAKRGVANPFVTWQDDLPELLEIMVRRLPAAGHAAALRHLGQNIARHSSGLPDLFLWTPTTYRFVEIKGENDHLSGHQFAWLRVLGDAGIDVGVEKIIRPSGRQVGYAPR